MRQVQTLQGPFWVYDQDHLGQVLEAGGWWDAQLKPFLDEADFSGWALDLGANVGWFTRYLAINYAGVLAVEAQPTTFDLLWRNVSDDPKVQLYHGAAYSHPVSLWLARGEDLGWPVPPDLNHTPNASSIAFVPTQQVGAAPIPGAPIDAWLDLHRPTAKVTLIKVDCQGADLRALYGLRDTIARCRPLIVFEFEEAASRWHGDRWDDYEQFFAHRNYRIERVREDLWDYVARPA